MNKEEFLSELNKRNIVVNEEQYQALIDLMDSTLTMNQKFNLTAIKDKDQFMEKMLFDSALALSDLDLTNKSIIDVGTGAGFPGMVIRILSSGEVTLLDSTKKKIDYLNEYATNHHLDVKAVTARAEDFAHENIEKYDYAIARAVSQLNVLLEFIIPLLKVKGIFIAMKGPGYEEEINASKKAFDKLSCHLLKIIEDELPTSHEKRVLIYIQKDKPTNKKYPRQYSEIKKLQL